MTDLLEWKVAAARTAGAVSRRAGRGGTSLPGKVLMRLEQVGHAGRRTLSAAGSARIVMGRLPIGSPSA